MPLDGRALNSVCKLRIAKYAIIGSIRIRNLGCPKNMYLATKRAVLVRMNKVKVAFSVLIRLMIPAVAMIFNEMEKDILSPKNAK